MNNAYPNRSHDCGLECPSKRSFERLSVPPPLLRVRSRRKLGRVPWPWGCVLLSTACLPAECDCWPAIFSQIPLVSQLSASLLLSSSAGLFRLHVQFPIFSCIFEDISTSQKRLILYDFWDLLFIHPLGYKLAPCDYRDDQCQRRASIVAMTG
ncbi:hypothetical protein Aperf_G00000118953 [Anoplocephala perfoliata]